MLSIIKNIVSDDDILFINNYLKNSEFNTKEKHIPLHNNLFENTTLNFGITTYGDMGTEISYIFDKICNAIQEKTSKISGELYGPPILTKSYIMQFVNQKEIVLGFDQSRPEKVFRSMVFWNNNINNISINFINKELQQTVAPGDIIIFPENYEFARTVVNFSAEPLYLSDFWNAPKDKSPYPGLNYEDIAWGNPMYDKID